jgi:hypothetical protein
MQDAAAQALAAGSLGRRTEHRVQRLARKVARQPEETPRAVARYHHRAARKLGVACTLLTRATRE